MTYVVAALAVVVALTVVLLAGVLRSHAEILRALHDVGIYADGRDQPAAGARLGGAAAGTADPDEGLPATASGPAPAHVSGSTPEGELVSLELHGRREPTLLAFLTTGCVTCLTFWEALATEQLPGFRVVVLTRGDEAESPGAVAELAPEGVTTLLSTQAWEDFGVPGAPYFIQVEQGRMVGEGVATSWEQLVRMLDRADLDRAELAAQGTGPGMTRRELFTAGPPPARSDRDLPGEELP
jgi:hypothetical protein